MLIPKACDLKPSSAPTEDLAEEDQGYRREGEEGYHDQGETREVFLHNGGAGEGAPHAAAQRGGEPPALAGVQQDQPYERHAEDRVQKRQYVSHADYSTIRSRFGERRGWYAAYSSTPDSSLVRAASTSWMKLSA